MLPASPRRQGWSSVHPQRYQGFDSTFVQGIILYYTPEAICQKCVVRMWMFLADNDPGTPKQVVVVAVVNHISLATTRAGPSNLVGGLMGTVDVVLIVAVAVIHHISWAAVRAGRSKHMGRLMGWAGRPIWSPHLMSRGPARPIKFREDGPRTGPAHQNLNSLGPARPSPSHFQKSPPGPARHNFQIGPARPGPDKRPMTSPGNFYLSFSGVRMYDTMDMCLVLCSFVSNTG